MISMRSAFLLSVALAMLLRPASGLAQQGAEVAPIASWAIGGSATVANGTVRYENGVEYGFVLGQRVEKNVNVEFSYSILPTKGHFDPSAESHALPATLDFTIHYLQFGAAYHALVEAVQPYLSTTCGVVWFRPADARYSGDWRLAFSTAMGVRLFFTEHVGLRFQGRVLFPVYFSKGGLWASVEGPGSGFHGGIPIVQTDLGAGVIISF